MELSTEGFSPTGAMSNAMQRGLDAVGQPDANVIVSGSFASTVQRLAPAEPSYDERRGIGVVAARTVPSDRGPVIVVNGDVALGSGSRSSDVERLLAHEAGHVSLHRRRESTWPRSFYANYPEVLAGLYRTAEVAIEEYRIERQLADLGYSVAERAAPSSLEDQLFELSSSVFEALWTPDGSTRDFAAAILVAMQQATVSLAYLAGHLAARKDGSFRFRQLSQFGKHHWRELVGDSWEARLRLYRSIPGADTAIDEKGAMTQLGAAVKVERAFLQNLGFSVTGGGSGESFNRTASDEILTARWRVLEAEADRRGL